MKRKTRCNRRWNKKKSRRRKTIKRRHGGMKNAAKCCAKTAAKLVSEGAIEIGKSNVQDEIHKRGPLHKIENQQNIRNRSPKSFNNFMNINENSPYYNTNIKIPPPNPFQHF